MKTLKEHVLTLDELAEYLKVSSSTLYKLAQFGEVPDHKVGKHWRFRRETIDRLMDSRGGQGKLANSTFRSKEK